MLRRLRDLSAIKCSSCRTILVAIERPMKEDVGEILIFFREWCGFWHRTCRHYSALLRPLPYAETPSPSRDFAKGVYNLLISGETRTSSKNYAHTKQFKNKHSSNYCKHLLYRQCFLKEWGNLGVITDLLSCSTSQVSGLIEEHLCC